MMMAPEVGDSRVDFGKPEIRSMRGGKSIGIAYIQMEQEMYWSTDCQGVAFGSLSEPFKFEGTQRTVFSTSSEYIVMPEQIFHTYLSNLINRAGGPKYFMEDEEVYLECTKKYPTLYFMFQEQWLEVSPSDYIVDWSRKKDESLCHLLIKPGLEFVMGIPLF